MRKRMTKMTSTTTSKNKEFSCAFKHLPAKRIFDIAFSGVVLLALSPLFLVIAAAIRMTSAGNAIYSQKRVGRGGRIFRCYKFRSMYHDAESRLQEILNNDPAKRQEWDAAHKLKNDPRVTPIGAYLRKTSLDEL